MAAKWGGRTLLVLAGISWTRAPAIDSDQVCFRSSYLLGLVRMDGECPQEGRWKVSKRMRNNKGSLWSLGFEFALPLLLSYMLTSGEIHCSHGEWGRVE